MNKKIIILIVCVVCYGLYATYANTRHIIITINDHVFRISEQDLQQGNAYLEVVRQKYGQAIAKSLLSVMKELQRKFGISGDVLTVSEPEAQLWMQQVHAVSVDTELRAIEKRYGKHYAENVKEKLQEARLIDTIIDKLEYLDDNERQMYKEINWVRTNPRGFADDKIKPYIYQLQTITSAIKINGKLYRASDLLRIYVKPSYRRLITLDPRRPLRPLQGLHLASRDIISDPHKSSAHISKTQGMQKPIQRVLQYTSMTETSYEVAENAIAYHENEAYINFGSAVVEWIVDILNVNFGHREAILYYKYTHMGGAIGMGMSSSFPKGYASYMEYSYGLEDNNAVKTMSANYPLGISTYMPETISWDSPRYATQSSVGIHTKNAQKNTVSIEDEEHTVDEMPIETKSDDGSIIEQDTVEHSVTEKESSAVEDTAISSQENERTI